MIPISVMATGKGTVSVKIKGRYGVGRPSRFTEYFKPIVFWNITYRCNLACKHCYLRAGPDISRPELPTEKLLDIANQLIELGIPLVIFTGGEPLIREDFWILSDKLSEAGKPKLSLSSNGTLITREVAKKLKDYNFTYVGISIDSLNPELHDEFRGVKGAFKAAIKGIENCVSEGIPVGIRTTITRWNINEVGKIIEFSEKLGVSRISLYILDTIGRGADIPDQLPTPNQLSKLAEELVELAKVYSNSLEILVVRANFLGIFIANLLAKNRNEFLQYLDMLEAQGDCGRKTISIYPDGTVRPCQFIDYVIIGDLRREKLREILRRENPRLKPFIEIHKMLRGERCGNCPFRRVCGGGSRNRALVLQGDFWGDDPLCIVNPKLLSTKWDIRDVI